MVGVGLLALEAASEYVFHIAIRDDLRFHLDFGVLVS